MIEPTPDNSGATPSPTSAFRCAPRTHLSKHGNAFGVYDLACALTATNGESFYASAANVAEHLDISVASARRDTKFLVKHGWLEQLDGLSRFGTNLYRCLPHDEWAAKHPGGCKEMRSASDPAVSRQISRSKSAPSPTPPESPAPSAVQDLTARLARLSADTLSDGATIAFGAKARGLLAALLVEYSPEDCERAFARWLDTQDFTSPRVLQYADANFAERAGDLLRSELQRQEQAERDRAAHERHRLRLIEQGEKERQEWERREVECKFDPLAALLSEDHAASSPEPSAIV